MSGPVNNPFGSGPFGRFDWSRYQLIDLLPEVYRIQDAAYGGQLTAFLEAIIPSLDYFIEKINKYDDLRNPLRSPVEESFRQAVRIIQVDNLGDGTSRVFFSQGPDGDVFDEMRPGQILVDSAGVRFAILQIHASDLPVLYDDPPIDPYTGNESGRNIVVRNIASGNNEIIPLVSGKTFNQQDVTPSPLDNGSNVGPYTFTVAYAPIAGNLVTVSWQEGGEDKTGYFVKDGRYFGQLNIGSSIDYTTGVVVVDPINGIAIDSGTLKVSYTTRRIYNENPTVTPVDNGINLGPYAVTAIYTPLEAFVVEVTWVEGAANKTGQFSSGGVPSGDLHASSTINFTTGDMSIVTASGLAIATDTLRITYLSDTVIPPDDGRVVGQNILALLAHEFGIDLDRRDPATYQRSYVYNAYQLWDLKGSAQGYQVMGQLAGYDVKASNLYRIDSATAAILPADRVFGQAGYTITENPGESLGTSITPLEDGVSVGAFAIQLLNYPVFQDADIILSWTEDGTPKTVTLDPSDVVGGSNQLDIDTLTANRTNGTISVLFEVGHPPDTESIRVTYTPTQHYTDLAPRRSLFDEVIADVIPVDLYCFDNDYPYMDQDVSITSIAVVSNVGSSVRRRLTATTSMMYLSFGTEGLFTDSAAGEYAVENFVRVNATTYTFEVVSAASPATGNGSVRWSVLRNTADGITDNPDTTAGSTITPDEDGSTLGPFTIQLSQFPLDSGPVDLYWEETGGDRFATITGTSTVSGTNSADIASAVINRTTGELTITFAASNPPDTDSIRVTYSALADFDIVGVGTDLTVMGPQFFGYSGIRYKLRKTFAQPIAIASVGNWKIVDSDGVQSWIEKLTLVSSSPYVYDVEFISPSEPATGPANIFYSCEVSTSCSYCAASAVRLAVRTDDVLNYPEALADGATDRLIKRLEQMLPAHVRFAEFDVFTEEIAQAVGISVGSSTAIGEA